jgi:hypothetical protein
MNFEGSCVRQLDAIVLAGGKSERLTGIVPPYHKPFVVVNGKSLLVAAVDSALDVGARRVVVVATGENALPVWQLIGHRPEVRVVLCDRGVARSVYVGLELITSRRVLVLMSDNVHAPGDVSRVCAEEYAIGVRELPHDEARRFTRLGGGRWVEGPGTPPDPDTITSTVWCGPLVLQHACAGAVLKYADRIGPHLAALAPHATHVTVGTEDIGVPSAVAQATRSTR